MTKLEELIVRLEEAKEGSRELDMEITELLYPRLTSPETRSEYGWVHPEHGKVKCSPYSTSIDAALQLVPRIEAPFTPAKEWPATVDLRRHDDGRATCAIRATDATPDEADDELFVEVAAATPALALCIAALKARAVAKKETE